LHLRSGLPWNTQSGFHPGTGRHHMQI